LSPEQDYPGKAIQSILGFLGLGNDDAKSNRFGQLLAAGMPIAGALKKIGVGEEAARDAILAWHASPHDFEQFDMGKVGTGQGAQSYGHGLYQAENPALSGLGGSYDREFTAQNLGKHDLNQAEDRVLQMIRKGHSPMEVLVDLGKSGLSFDEAQAVYDRVDKAKAKIYRTAIKADPDQFLDWDKPLSQQPAIVKQLQARGITIPADSSVTGESLVRDLGTRGPEYLRLFSEQQSLNAKYPGRGIAALRFKGPDAANDLQRFLAIDSQLGSIRERGPSVASNELRQAGIPGIKYLDQGSRVRPVSTFNEEQAVMDAFKAHRAAPTAETQKALEAAQSALDAAKNKPNVTHNYVVFDDKLIDILKKYAVAGAVGGSLASLGQPPAEEQK
jgi:hypothetical protein